MHITFIQAKSSMFDSDTVQRSLENFTRKYVCNFVCIYERIYLLVLNLASFVGSCQLNLPNIFYLRNNRANKVYLFFSVESTALRLIMGLGSDEVQPQLSRVLSEPKSLTLLSNESEELNRALVLTLARSMHVTGMYSEVPHNPL